MRLYLDIGNTAMKWRAYPEAGGPAAVRLEGGRAHQRDWVRLAEELAAQCAERVTQLEVASVAGRESDILLGEALDKALGCRPRFYYSPASDYGVTNAYAEPARLGVDRWLAVVEAWHRDGAAIIIDCGSALTVDAVDAAGAHLGGYIVPGLGMLRESLFRGTAQVRVTEAVNTGVGLGRSTSEGVEHGVLRMSVAFVADVVVELRKTLNDTCSVYLTGGDARVLQPLLPFQVPCDPDLVLDGLERVTAGNL